VLALVVYESVFGSTLLIARAIAQGLSHRYDVRLSAAASASAQQLAEAELLVIGAPTHAQGLPRLDTRAAAARHSGVAAAPLGVVDLLATLPRGHGRGAAAFDTRFDKPEWLVGSASRPIAKELLRSGYVLLDVPRSFFVSQAEGPMLDGELERAERWGASLRRLRHPVPHDLRL
jgi:hypothetical protein